MNGHISRRGFLGGVAIAALAGPALAGAPAASLRPVLRGQELFRQSVPGAAEIVAAQKLSGDVAFALADLQTGNWLECENEQLATPPASVTKAVTALYALGVLGADHQFETQLGATGTIADGVVQGDVLLIGGGDPTLDTDALADMAAALKAAGVREVRGAFKVFEAGLPVMREIDPMQPEHVGYNPAVAGLALNYNRVHFEWKRAGADYTITMDGRSERYRPDVTMATMRVEDRSTPVYTYRDAGGRDHWTVAKGALGKGGARWLPVRRPGLYAGEVFQTMAGAHGIRLPNPEVITTLPAHEVLLRHQSGALRGILQDMLKYSTNLTAEMVGLAASQARLGPVADLRASAAAMNRWAVEALGMQAPALVDHSGLGEDSRLTALDMVRALVAVRDTDFRGILKTFGFRDEKGRPVKEQAIAVDAKTGTLNFVSTLAGYVTGREGREMAFAIFTADPEARARIAPEDRESPPGARTWNRKSKRVQQGLIERWDAVYGKKDA